MLRNLPKNWRLIERRLDGLMCSREWRGVTLFVIASWGRGWDHVSISRPDGKMPTWDQAKLVARAFFRDEWCIQYVPPAAYHVDYSDVVARDVLHLWRPHNDDIPTPPMI